MRRKINSSLALTFDAASSIVMEELDGMVSKSLISKASRRVTLRYGRRFISLKRRGIDVVARESLEEVACMALRANAFSAGFEAEEYWAMEAWIDSDNGARSSTEGSKGGGPEPDIVVPIRTRGVLK